MDDKWSMRDKVQYERERARKKNEKSHMTAYEKRGILTASYLAQRRLLATADSSLVVVDGLVEIVSLNQRSANLAGQNAYAYVVGVGSHEGVKTTITICIHTHIHT